MFLPAPACSPHPILAFTSGGRLTGTEALRLDLPLLFLVGKADLVSVALLEEESGQLSAVPSSELSSDDSEELLSEGLFFCECPAGFFLERHFLGATDSGAD